MPLVMEALIRIVPEMGVKKTLGDYPRKQFESGCGHKIDQSLDGKPGRCSLQQGCGLHENQGARAVKHKIRALQEAGIYKSSGAR